MERDPIETSASFFLLFQLFLKLTTPNRTLCFLCWLKRLAWQLPMTLSHCLMSLMESGIPGTPGGLYKIQFSQINHVLGGTFYGRPKHPLLLDGNLHYWLNATTHRYLSELYVGLSGNSFFSKPGELAVWPLKPAFQYIPLPASSSLRPFLSLCWSLHKAFILIAKPHLLQIPGYFYGISSSKRRPSIWATSHGCQIFPTLLMMTRSLGRR